MNKDNRKIVVLGAGISGLTVAYWLRKAGLDATVLEANDYAGGTMRTTFENGFLIERGPNSGLESSPEVGRLVDALGVRDELIYASAQASKRYILKNNRLVALPASPPAFLRTGLFSLSAKLRLLKEPFVGLGRDDEETVAGFVRRRLGREFLDYAVNPFVSGIFAGDPAKLSVRYAFPKLYELEAKYGGLIKGAVKGARERKRRAEKSKRRARMFSFRRGMQFLPTTLAEQVRDGLRLRCKVESIEKSGEKYVARYTEDGRRQTLEADVVISAVPAYRAAEVFQTLDAEIGQTLSQIYYPPVMTLFLGYRTEAVPRPLDGFGFLIPEKENKKLLGAIWNSTIFEDRAPDGRVCFTLFIGGARSPQLFSGDRDALISQVLEEFSEISGIKEEPLFRRVSFWEKAIPQYNTGYGAMLRAMEEFENRHSGVFLAGNYRGGISLSDCIKNATLLADKISGVSRP